MALVSPFAQGMELRLGANDDKPGWQRDIVELLLAQVRASRKELAVSVLGKESVAVVDRRATNLGNFAIMVADRHGLWLSEVGGDS